MVVGKISFSQCKIPDVVSKRGLDPPATWGFYASRTTVDEHMLTSCELNKFVSNNINVVFIKSFLNFLLLNTSPTNCLANIIMYSNCFFGFSIILCMWIL